MVNACVEKTDVFIRANKLKNKLMFNIFGNVKNAFICITRTHVISQPCIIGPQRITFLLPFVIESRSVK